MYLGCSERQLNGARVRDNVILALFVEPRIIGGQLIFCLIQPRLRVAGIKVGTGYSPSVMGLNATWKSL